MVFRTHRASQRIARRVLLAAGVVCLTVGGPSSRAQDAPRGLRIIVVDSEAEALRLAGEIREGGSFALFAARHSTDPSAVRQGILGRFVIEDLRAEYHAALAGLPAGAATDPIPVEDGFSLLAWMTPEDEAWVARRDRGIVAAGEGRYDEAERIFAIALAEAEAAGVEDLRLGESLGDLAELRRLQGRADEAAPLLERTLRVLEPLLGRSHPGLTAPLNDLAEIYRMRGEADRATATLRLGASGTGNPAALSESLDVLMEVLAAGLTAMDEPEARIRHLADVVLRASVAERLPAAVGGILTTAGLTSAARLVLDRAVERFPDSRRLHSERAALALRLGSIDAAIADYERAHELDGAFPPAARIHAGIGDAWMELSRGEDALTAYGRAEALDLGNGVVHVRIGHALARLGRHEQALDAYAHAIDLDPALAEAHAGAAESDLRANRFDAAAAAARRAVAAGGADRRMWYLQGLALVRAGRPEAGRDAMAEYERLGAEARSRESRLVATVVAARRAVEAHGEGDSAGAIHILEGATRAAPEALRLRLTLGLIQLESGRYDDAVRTFERMRDAGQGDDSLVQWSLARAHRGRGDTAAAQRHEALFLERVLVELGTHADG